MLVSLKMFLLFILIVSSENNKPDSESILGESHQSKACLSPTRQSFKSRSGQPGGKKKMVTSSSGSLPRSRSPSRVYFGRAGPACAYIKNTKKPKLSLPGSTHVFTGLNPGHLKIILINICGGLSACQSRHINTLSQVKSRLPFTTRSDIGNTESALWGRPHKSRAGSLTASEDLTVVFHSGSSFSEKSRRYATCPCAIGADKSSSSPKCLPIKDQDSKKNDHKDHNPHF